MQEYRVIIEEHSIGNRTIQSLSSLELMALVGR